MAFFTSRYFGARNYAKIYGTMFGMFALGVGIGPDAERRQLRPVPFLHADLLRL